MKKRAEVIEFLLAVLLSALISSALVGIGYILGNWR